MPKIEHLYHKKKANEYPEYKVNKYYQGSNRPVSRVLVNAINFEEKLFLIII